MWSSSIAVTTTYSWAPVGTLTDFVSQGNRDIIGLANGEFAPIFDINGTVYGTVSNSTGGFVANLAATGLNASLAQLSNANIAIATELGDDIFVKVVKSSTGVDVVASLNVSLNGGDITSSNADAIGLTGGGFWVAAQTDFHNSSGDPDHDIVVFRRNNDGTAAGSFAVDSLLAEDTGVSIVQLDNGNVAVAWTRTVGTSTQAWSAVYTAAGAVVKAPAAFDTSSPINRNLHVTATDGGFVIVYEDREAASASVDFYLATFNLAGTWQSSANVSADSTLTANETDPTVTRLANGLLAVAYTDNSNLDTT